MTSLMTGSTSVSVHHIRKKDLVQVMVGKERGKTGKVLRINQKHGRVVVEKLNMVKRHTKATGQKPGGIVEKESSFAASNLLLYCDKCGRGVRTGYAVPPGVKGENKPGKKTRVCKRCSTPLDKGS